MQAGSDVGIGALALVATIGGDGGVGGDGYQPSQTRAERRCWGSLWQHIERQRKSAEQTCEWAPRPMFITSRPETEAPST